MALKRQNSDITNVMRGADEVAKIYRGASLVWERSSGSTLPNNLIAYWKFDETSGGAADAVGANSLTDSGGSSFVTGKVSNARNLVAASSQYLYKTAPSGLAPGTSDFAVSFWINPATDTGFQTLLSWGMQSASNSYIWIYVNGGSLSVQFVDGLSGFNTMNTGVTFSTSSWQHLALNFDRSGNMTVYKNNTLSATHDISGHQGNFTPSGGFYIGQYSEGGLHFNGAVDEGKFWHRVLTTDEIAEDYANGVAGNPLL